MKVVFRKKIWDVLTPKNLNFPKQCIRNVIIERGNKRIITNLKQVKVCKTNFGDITSWS